VLKVLRPFGAADDRLKLIAGNFMVPAARVRV